jgi:hypothetical protein
VDNVSTGGIGSTGKILAIVLTLGAIVILVRVPFQANFIFRIVLKKAGKLT